MRRYGLVPMAAVIAIGLLAAIVWMAARPAGRMPAPTAAPVATGTPEDPDARDEMEFLISRDPVANAIPRGIRRRELDFARALPSRGVRLKGGPGRTVTGQPLVWTERGPNNVGGRTRVFAVDVSAPTTLIAGSVAGGIWRSTDEGASWSLRTDPAQIHGTTCIAQDTRPGHTDVWYVGTGEIRGSTTNATRWGSLYLGDGIFKSTDGGASWTLLPSTSSGTPQTAEPFDYVNNVATNPANTLEDEVLAATYRGIYRSLDGGGSWSLVLASDSGYTDVAVTATGVRYATTRSGSNTTIWRSPGGSGTPWTEIQPGSFPTPITRVAIGLAPSNPDIAYFFISVGIHRLFKYVYLSGDGSGIGGQWVDRTSFLPQDLSTQAGYDQIIHVKPDDENFVLIGGTDLFRSTDGFASNAAVTVIGGYPFWPGGHHPDMQSGAFSPTDPSVYYSANDGGVWKAPDITEPDMVWETLNHGYNVTQFYSVAIAPDAGSNVILAGAQDNGSQLGTSPGASDWIMAYGGDGTIVEVSPAADDRLYTQYQNGPIQRQNWDGSNVTVMTPAGAANQLFVNPIVLDPNDTRLLYYAAGVSGTTSRIWRNDNAPLAEPSIGWTALTPTDVGAGAGYARRISALGISTSPANILYYGTVDGIVKKAVGINGTPTVTTITPPGLLGGTVNGGFVRAVAVDPEDANRALVAFGNYNFRSLWYTTNGGTTWTDVEGNLAGPTGPSIRWATIFHFEGQLHVFLGTSIGVLSTQALAGAATVWSQEAGEEIGNVLIATMDYRPSDATLAVGTHGRGVFTTRFMPVTATEPTAVHGRIALGPSRPNPTRGAATIAFTLPRSGPVSLKLYDVSGREVAAVANGWRDAGRHEERLGTDRLASGAYFCVLEAAGAVETRRVVVRK